MKVADIKAEVGRRLRALREKKGWSQEELGFRANLHRNYVGGIERGERNVGVENIAKLAGALRIRPRDLLP
jgi:transcriptional regulator with XRE-family HTH domain